MTILIVVLSLLLLLGNSREDSDLRVSNGRETIKRFLVEILIKVPQKRIKCSGSILNSHWVITSGHCFDEGKVLYVKINRFTTAAPVMNVDKVLIHPKYQHKKDKTLLNYVKHDLALLRTSEPMNFNGLLRPIDLDDTPPIEGSAATVAGFGLPDLEAREGDMIISYCNGGLLLCCQSSEGQARPGHGDSGGPLIAKGRLIGVDSTSVLVTITKNRSKSKVFYTEYFADIASNYKWIESVIR